ncbi:MAG: DNA polymerase [Nitrosarchaeum sp.]|nr:DNA polymerase [Nitrosarchaeum sp.]
MAEPIRITDCKILSKLFTKHQDRNEAKSDLRPVYALDTETDENGDVTVLADSEGNYLELDDITPEKVIKFLFSKRYQGSWNFFYNITFDAEVILKIFGDLLYDYKRTRILRFQYQDYIIEYIPQKKIAIRKGHHSAVFFDIAQYYHESLSNAYQSNIGKLPDWYTNIKKQRSHFTRKCSEKYPAKIRKYCIQDCIYTKELAEHWIKVFRDAFDFYPQRFISSGYLAEKVLINNKIQIPLFGEIPFKINEFAWRSYFGARFEILKRGFIGTAHLYDINSAYPYVLANIPDITKGKWRKSKKIIPHAHLGFFKIQCDIPDCKYIPPFPFRTNRMLIFPSGKFVTYCTLAELKACNNPKYYKILESFQYTDENPIYPYKDFIESIYQKRLEFKQNGNPLQLPLKIILNSIYGKTAQRVGNRIGNLFSPVISSTITGTTRAMLYDFVEKYGIENDVVSFATDSILTTKKLNIDSSDLGGWAFENSGDDAYVLQNGIFRLDKIWKKRGIGNLGNRQIEHLDTIEKNGQLYQVMKVLRVNRLRTAILSNSINEIGKFKTVERRVNLNADRKRMWFEDLRDVNDGKMIDSMSISLNFI